MRSQAQFTRGNGDSPAMLLRKLVEGAVQRSTAKAILLSGGLDTSIICAAAAKQGRDLLGISVSVAGTVSPDEPYAKKMAEHCGFQLRVLRPTPGDLIAVMPDVMRVLRTFDPMELRNSVVVWLALRSAREEGITEILTGDAADELFAGYSYIFNLPSEQVRPYLDFLNGVMRFSSVPMGASLGVIAQLPYLDPAVRDIALTMSRDDLVGESHGQRFGKKILRETFADLLPEQVTWRVKTPIEYGSGSTTLQEFVINCISDAEFQSAKTETLREYGITLRDKEQFFYYRIYRTLFHPPCEQVGGVKRCGSCRGAIERAEQKYCFVCGAYPC